MTPQDKADELVTKYRRFLPMNLTTMLDAKGCAIIAVDEIMKALGKVDKMYWEEVKQEIREL